MLLVKMMILMIRMINNWLDETHTKKKEQPLEGSLTQRFFIYYGLAAHNTSPDRKKFSTNSSINELFPQVLDTV